MLTIEQVSFSQKRVLIRVDFNVPMQEGKITSDQRIQAALPTIRTVLSQGGQAILLSHLGRPVEGEHDQQHSLALVAERLASLLQQPVHFVRDYFDSPIPFIEGQAVLLENARFNVGEKSVDESLSKQLASLCDIFVFDAFAVAHRAQASTTGVARYAPQVCAGSLMTAELAALEKALHEPKAPVVAIVGGSKVSTKLSLLRRLCERVDHLIVGGGIANTFLAAQGVPMGNSLYEPALVDEAKQLLTAAHRATIHVPEDIVVANAVKYNIETQTIDLQSVQPDQMILDIGPKTIARLTECLKQAGTIIWNGPVGVFEMPPFAMGTQALSQAIADSPAYSLAGGGDTLAAVEQFGVTESISYISTGGGAFLAYVEGQSLPAVDALNTYSQPIGELN